jgi:hypothetical protein
MNPGIATFVATNGDRPKGFALVSAGAGVLVELPLPIGFPLVYGGSEASS